MRLLYDNQLTDPATALAASSEVSALPAEAIQNSDRAYVWRSATATGVQTIDIDLGAVVAITDVAVANVTLLGSGVLELYQRGDAGAAGAATLVDTFDAQDADTRVAVVTFASQSHRHWQLKWTNPTAVSGYAELGYAFFGTALSITDALAQNPAINRNDPAVMSQSVDGQQSYAERTSFASGQWAWRVVVDDTLVDNLRTVYRTVGRRTPLFAVLDTTRGWAAWLCRLTSDIQARGLVDLSVVDLSVSWEEVR
jgi:hypothetical protein